MQRMAVDPRPDWREKLDCVGFSFHSMDGVYWDESACYRFTSAQIHNLEAATTELHRLCLQAIDHIIAGNRFEQMRIPPEFVPLVCASWQARAPSLYGRFDLSYNGVDPPRMLEYNADTPTAILEAAVAQWHWLEDTGRPDQFNSLHERLIEQWRRIASTLPVTARVHFSCVKDNEEDLVTTEYLRDLAIQAGLDTRFCFVEDIGWSGQDLIDLDDVPLRTWFKLYPWEWLMREDYSQHLRALPLTVLEPAWKALLSNKAILPVLWELFPGHPNLLPAYFERDAVGDAYVRKPLFSREGANVEIRTPDLNMITEGRYDLDACIYQQWCPLPEFQGRYPVIGSWIVGDEAAGIGIREDRTLVTTNRSRFIPHYFD